MFTTVAYSKNVDCLGVFTNVIPVPDQHVKTGVNDIIVGALNNLVAAYCLAGAAGLQARLVAPSLRRVNPYCIAPFELVSIPSLNPTMMYHPESPVPLDVNESLEAEIDATNADTAQKTVVVWLSDGVLTPTTGEIFTINAHVTVAGVLNVWTFAEITFPDSLPVADYAVVGARLRMTDCAAFRFVPVGAFNRPGGIGSHVLNQNDPWCQRFGRMGEWFQFNTVQPPGIEVLGGAAEGSATWELFIDAIKLT